MNNHKLVFIVGLHRSGTSLLFKCLRAHPEISGFKDTGVREDEGQFLQTVYPPGNVYGGAGRFGFNSASHLTESSLLVSRENADKLFREWSRYWDPSKPILLEKSPPNMVRTRFLQALFPDSYFVVLQRHPIAVSYATQRWKGTPIYSLVEHWLECHDRFDADKQHLRSFLTFKYEHFVENPQSILDQIYEFIGVEPCPVAEEVRTEINAKYFARWAYLRRGILTRFYANHIIAKFEARVNGFGYSLRHPEQLSAS